jgi:hypothetical protein
LKQGGRASRRRRTLSSKGATAVDPNILAFDEVRSRPEQIYEYAKKVVGRFPSEDAALRGGHLPHLRAIG